MLKMWFNNIDVCKSDSERPRQQGDVWDLEKKVADLTRGVRLQMDGLKYNTSQKISAGPV